MPTTFQDREQAFEARFAREEEFRFRVLARRDKLFARWAAAELGLAAPVAQDLMTSVLAVADGPGHDRALLQHVAGQFASRQRPISAEALAAALERSAGQARAELAAQPPGESDIL